MNYRHYRSHLKNSSAEDHSLGFWLKIILFIIITQSHLLTHCILKTAYSYFSLQLVIQGKWPFLRNVTSKGSYAKHLYQAHCPQNKFNSFKLLKFPGKKKKNARMNDRLKMRNFCSVITTILVRSWGKNGCHVWPHECEWILCQLAMLIRSP